jgi:branched-chain amino acid:cation transporter, LIVCS family
MNKWWSRVVTTSMAIFAMLFGAGNLMLPLKVGLLGGSENIWGLLGFIVTGVVVPMLGLLVSVVFEGDYRAYFGRVGLLSGKILIFFSMMTLGPLIILPRIVALTYTMLQPFLPPMQPWFFAALFLSLAYIATYQQERLLALIGKILSPLKVISLASIIIVGLWSGTQVKLVTDSLSSIFSMGVRYGYGTLDLIGTVFFGSVIIALLQQEKQTSMKSTVRIAACAAFGAALLLSMVYAGMTYLGVFHGYGFEALNEGELFSAISFRILGTCGAALIGLTVFLACFTTTVALSTVVATYMHQDILQNRISYPLTLAIMLGICMIPASFDLSVIMRVSLPIIVASYPLFITIMICNGLYKLCGFSYIKMPVMLTLAWIVITQFLY